MSDPAARDATVAWLVQTESISGERDRNIEAVSTMVRRQEKPAPDLVVVPEFFNTGYFPLRWDYRGMELAEPQDGPTVTAMAELARDLETHVVTTFFEYDSPGLYFDTTVIVGPSGEFCGKYRKTHPPARVSVEKLYYRPGSHLPVFDLLGWRIGVLICYDNYVVEAPRAMMVQGAEIIIAPFAEVAGFDMWEPLLRARAFENGVYVAACNLVGEETRGAPVRLGGASIVVDPAGTVLARGSSTQPEVIAATLRRDTLISTRARRQWLRDRRPELYGVLAVPQEDARSLQHGLERRGWYENDPTTLVVE
jgi:predicted amidohydrolase